MMMLMQFPLAVEGWILLFISLAVPLIIILWVLSSYHSTPKPPMERTRVTLRPADGSDGIAAAHGAEESYFPVIRGSEKAGFPVGRVGHGGKGAYGHRAQRNEELIWCNLARKASDVSPPLAHIIKNHELLFRTRVSWTLLSKADDASISA